MRSAHHSKISRRSFLAAAGLAAAGLLAGCAPSLPPLPPRSGEPPNPLGDSLTARRQNCLKNVPALI